MTLILLSIQESFVFMVSDLNYIHTMIYFTGVKEKALENLISKTCEEVALTTLHPRSAMQIVIQILQDSGSVNCFGINFNNNILF